MSKVNKGMMSSTTNEWYTPKEFFDTLKKEFDFNLDPCCTKQSAKCDIFFTKEDDGLTKDWGVHIVFMNPPYGREIKDWIRKAYDASLSGATVVALIPARTDTRYWHEYIFNKADEIRFLKGRIKFEDINGEAKNSAPFPSAVIVWKNKNKIA